MTMTDLQRVRLYIQDDLVSTTSGILPGNAHFTDAEIGEMIATTGSWKSAIPLALRTAASAYSRKAHSNRISDYWEDWRVIAQNLRDQAEMFEKSTLANSAEMVEFNDTGRPFNSSRNDSVGSGIWHSW